MLQILSKVRTLIGVPNTIKNFKAAALVVLLAIGSVASASHYRYGNMSWQTVPGMPNTVDVTIQQAWRYTFFNPTLGGTASTGSLVIPGQSSRSINLTVTTINIAEDWFYGTTTMRITFPTAGSYTVYQSSCCRIGALKNNPNGNYRGEAVITIGNGNNGPNSTIAPIVNLQQGQSPATFLIPATDPDGDPLTYRIATSSETAVSPLSGFTVTSNGLASYNTVGKTVGSLYQAQVAVEDAAGAKTVLDFLIKIVAPSNAPVWDYSVTPNNGTVYNVRPGDTVKFDLKAFDLDVADNVKISAVGIPVGAVVPNSPGGNPDSTSFFWIPTNANLGTSVVNFVAQDNNGTQTFTSVSIIVSQAPEFDVPPTPAMGVHNYYSCGDTIKFMVQASDRDPNDSVVINKVQGKAMNGSKIPLYPGASFTPLPTPLANPTMGMFEWIVQPGDWGHRHVFFTAEDQLGEKTVHEVSQLINTPPMFTTTPTLVATVNQLYSYAVQLDDKDVPYGDTLDMYAFGLPSWLNFVDNGDGTGLLSGTPAPGDLGGSITLEGQDIHHHHTGSVYQYFTITVNDTVATPGCTLPGSLNLVSDGSWMMSTVTTPSNLSGHWAGIGGILPADATFSIPAMVGQPYAFPSIDSVDGAQVIETTNNVTYFQKKVNLNGVDDLAAHIKMTVDDHTEIYVNGQLVVAQYNGLGTNFKNPAFDATFMANGSIVNPNAGGEAFDFTTATSLSSIFVPGMNTITVVIRNYNKPGDRGGFSLLMDLDYTYQSALCGTLDSCVSDSTWMLSTVVTTATSNMYPWPGVGTVPAAATFTLPVVVGQPYPWNHLYTVPGSEVISSLSGVTYYRKTFELVDHLGVNTRIRMFMDDNVEVFINGVLLAREEDMGKANWRTQNHDILFKADGTVDNGHMGGDMFDYAATVNMDTVLNAGTNDIVLAIRNRTSKPDKGGFSFRMDMDKGGSPVIKKSSGASPQVNVEELSAEVYPNPTSGWVNLSLELASTQTTGTVVVLDLNGKVLQSFELDSNEIQVNLESYPAGVYFIKVNTLGSVHTAKVLKK